MNKAGNPQIHKWTTPYRAPNSRVAFPVVSNRFRVPSTRKQQYQWKKNIFVSAKLSMTNLSSIRPEENVSLGNRLPIFQPACNNKKKPSTSHTFITSIIYRWQACKETWSLREAIYLAPQGCLQRILYQTHTFILGLHRHRHTLAKQKSTEFLEHLGHLTNFISRPNSIH